MFESLEVFLNYPKINIGQVGLIQNIFENNRLLLTKHVNPKLIMSLVNFINEQGRQVHILHLLLTLLQHNNVYVFENQLQILNHLIPNQKLNKTQDYKYLFSKIVTKKQ